MGGGIELLHHFSAKIMVQASITSSTRRRRLFTTAVRLRLRQLVDLLSGSSGERLKLFRTEESFPAVPNRLNARPTPLVRRFHRRNQLLTDFPCPLWLLVFLLIWDQKVLGSCLPVVQETSLVRRI